MLIPSSVMSVCGFRDEVVTRFFIYFYYYFQERRFPTFAKGSTSCFQSCRRQVELFKYKDIRLRTPSPPLHHTQNKRTFHWHKVLSFLKFFQANVSSMLISCRNLFLTENSWNLRAVVVNEMPNGKLGVPWCNRIKGSNPRQKLHPHRSRNTSLIV